MRIQVILADGVTAFDSNKLPVINDFNNINKILDGKYLINENQNSRSYNMGAALSQSGVFTQLKYSNSTGENEMYLVIRQGLSMTEPLGNVVISMIKTTHC